MYLCYIDESGTPDVPGNTSHYVLAGVSIPVQYWRDCDEELFDLIFPRADRRGNTVVGIRHFTNPACTCKICAAHRLPTHRP